MSPQCAELKIFTSGLECLYVSVDEAQLRIDSPGSMFRGHNLSDCFLTLRSASGYVCRV